jgi:subtilase family serine protease
MWDFPLRFQHWWFAGLEPPNGENPEFTRRFHGQLNHEKKTFLSFSYVCAHHLGGAGGCDGHAYMSLHRTLHGLIRSMANGLTLAMLAVAASGAPRQLLSGHVPAGISKLHTNGAPAPSQRLDLAIGLPLRHQAQLANFLDQLYNPASPHWRRYLTVEQFTGLFGPTASDYEELIAFARNNGFKITGQPSNRMLLKVNATVAQIESAFHVHLRQYQHPTENRQFYAPDAEPSVDLAVPVLHVSGLDNYRLPRPGGHAASGKDPKTSPDGAGGASGGTGPSGSFRGMDFRNAYAPGVTLTGAGQIVGLAEFDGYYATDIATYASQSRLPGVPLTNVLVGGFNGVPGDGVNDVFEVSLDIEMAASMAPGLSQIMVYETSSYGLGDEMLNQMATDNLAQELSCSWWFSYNPTTAQIFQEFAAQGQSFFIASEDNDAYNAQAGDGVLPPLDYPYTTVVGGTFLTTGASGAWSSESVWNFNNGTGSGGGISSTYPIPSWQQSVNMSANGGSTNWRNIPDVACVAAGLYVVYNNNQTTTSGWGTSFATPLWAGFAALAGQQAASNGLPRLGFLNPLIYQIGQGSFYGGAFHDITTGNNTNSASPTEFFATAGYDLCTGWGTPNGANLINLLAPALTQVVLSAPILSGGKLQFTASGLAFGTTNYLQASANLSSPANWVSIATNLATNSSQVISGLSPTNSVRFFRMVEQP